ncbi:MAG TPA: AMIN domain-containing protein [Polyangiales bacterium]|nr:AMIN domain-containing protein [Polyangiales bacterium]
MLRASAGWSWAFGILAAASVVRAEEGDGPDAVNTTESISAGADYDIRQAARGSIVRDEPLAVPTDGHPLGSYAGVVPGNSSAPPVQAPKTETKPLITWPGFQMRQDGTSRVFIQSTGALTPQPSAAPAKFSVYLPGAKVAGNTNRLPLETRFFNTPVARVNIDVQKEGVTLVLDMRADISPVVSSERGPTGYYFLYIDLPKGQYVQTPPPAADAPPSPGAQPKHLDSAPAKASVEGSASVQTKASASSSQNQVKASGKADAKGGIKLGL